jgi:hypothetical protein
VRTPALAALLAWSAAPAPPPGGYEDPPTLEAAAVAAPELLRGPHHVVDDASPVEGFLAQFRVRSEFGVFEADGLEMLHVRVSEVYALGRLEEVRRTEVFATSLKEAARKPYVALKRVVEDPVDTAKGVPAGVGRFFKRAYKTARRGVEKAQDAREQETDEREAEDKSGGEKAKEAAGAAGSVAKDLFGWSRARREWARRLEVDPYTSNALLAERLDEVAWAAFAGGFTFGAMLPPVPALVSRSVTASNLAWELPPEDVEERNDRALAALDVGQDERRAFLRNPHWHPSLSLGFVDALGEIGPTRGLGAVVGLAASARDEAEARFFRRAVTMLAAARKGFRELFVAAELVAARTGPGVVVLPLPVDHLHWTLDLDELSRRPEYEAQSRAAAGGPELVSARAACGRACARGRVASLGTRPLTVRSSRRSQASPSRVTLVISREPSPLCGEAAYS